MHVTAHCGPSPQQLSAILFALAVEDSSRPLERLRGYRKCLLHVCNDKTYKTHLPKELIREREREGGRASSLVCAAQAMSNHTDLGCSYRQRLVEQDANIIRFGWAVPKGKDRGKDKLLSKARIDRGRDSSWRRPMLAVPALSVYIQTV